MEVQMKRLLSDNKLCTFSQADSELYIFSDSLPL